MVSENQRELEEYVMDHGDSSQHRGPSEQMSDLTLTFSHYERRYEVGGWSYLVSVYLDNKGRKRIIPIE